MCEYSTDWHLERELEEILTRQTITPDTYSQRLRLLRVGLIIPVGAVTAFACLYFTAPLIEIAPFPLSVVAPVIVVFSSFIFGIVAGETASVVLDKLVPRTGD